jgi:hypothetical protein
MKNQFLKTIISPLMLVLILTFTLTGLGYSQQLNKIYEDIGGGSGSTNSTVESDDDYTLYIVGGLVVTGIVVYALLHDKKEKQTIDTTAALLNDEFLSQNLSYNERVANMQSQIPINISIGIQRDKALKDERRYYVGVNYNF